jgi:23S rRNA G2445 N2-methylase RlmL
MCGAGTILAELLGYARKSRIRPAICLGGDIEYSALRAASSNLRRLGDSSLVRWNAALLPLATESVNRIISNPPFGKQLGESEQMGLLYRRILKEFNRVLRHNGRAVLLVSDLGALKEAATKVKWERRRQLRVRVLGQPAFVTVWEKSQRKNAHEGKY